MVDSCNCGQIVATAWPRERATLIGVQAAERTEVIALDVFTRAQDAGQVVTMDLVERRLEQRGQKRLEQVVIAIV